MQLAPTPSSPRASRMRFALVALCGLASLMTTTVTRAQQPAHLAAGVKLVDEITAAQKLGVYTGNVGGATVFLNRYGGTWNTPGDLSFIRFFDQPTATYAANYTTCAPLVTHLLKHAYGWDWRQFSIPDSLDNGALVSKASPKSYLYVSAIKHGVGFTQQSATLADVQPGDIAARWEVGTDEGHTMIVVKVDPASAKAYPLTSSDPSFVPELAGATYTEVTVLDSSASGHTSDTRMITYGGKTELSGGVGIGVLGVFTNATGEVIAHTWSLPTSNYLSYDKVLKKSVVNPYWLSGIKTRLKQQADVELVFGRLPAMPAIVP